MSTSFATLNYRADVDGLRAVAVLPVVLFHARVPGFGGGYVGVDVFFVISGYLITQLLLADYEAGTFSIVRFYERRIRRIFPALFVVLAAAGVTAWWLLLPHELRRFGASLSATAVFGSNFVFFAEAGYFDSPSERKLLLHTWSLAVEEQFYLVFPWVFALLTRRGARARGVVVVGMAALSLALAVHGSHAFPDATFYLAPTRAWELLLGSILALRLVSPLRSRAMAEAAAWVGLGLIVASIVGLSRDSRFPGMLALLPCGGAALVIHAGASRPTLLRRWLGWRPVVFVGLISYSLYLWHWVTLTLAGYLTLEPLATGQAALAIAAAFVLAAASWRWIETPVRRSAVVPRRSLLFAAALAASLTAGVAGFVLWASGGAPGRLPVEARQLADGARDRWPRTAECEDRVCAIGPAVGPRTVLWGDSHATALAPAFERAPTRVLLATSLACPPLIGMHAYRPKCGEFGDELTGLVRLGEVSRVVLHARWAMYVHGTRFGREAGRPIRLDPSGRLDNARALETALTATVRELRGLGVDVVIVGPVPEAGVPVPEALARAALRDAHPPVLPRMVFDSRQARSLEIIGRVAAAEGATYVALHPSLCDTEACRLQSGGRALYSDDDHLSLHGVQQVEATLRRALWP